MQLCFITGNAKKFAEVQAVLPQVVQRDIDLPEIQEIDSRKVIEAKLEAAMQKTDGEFIIEDTSFTLDCLNGQLPGPLIKWVLETIGPAGIFEIAKHSGAFGAEAKVTFGYSDKNSNIEFFEGALRGIVKEPTGEDGFGFDYIFQPDDCTQTFAQMGFEEKNTFSMRRIALEKLKKFLEK